MPIILIALLLLPLTEPSERSLMVKELNVKVEIVEANIIEDQADSDFRKVLIKKGGQVLDQVLLEKSNRGDYGYQIFDHYVDARSGFVVIGSYDNFYIYSLQTLQISDLTSACKNNYCELIDAQSCAIMDIKVLNNGQLLSLKAKDCKEMIIELEDISWRADSLTNQIEKVAWLVGTWENRTANGSIYETWKKTSEKELFGKSYRLEDNDTAVFETIQVIEKESSLFFIPTVKNQNNALPIEFSLKAISENNFAFKNPDHDFPQVISYTRITPDSLVAEVSGTENGAERKLTFSMRRINQ